MSALFVSDLHLSESAPANAAAFLELLRGKARSVEALYILGDLFEYWAGDDDLESPLTLDVARALASLATSGTRIAFMAGNRDFLLGPDYASRAGFEFLVDPSTIELEGGRRVLLSHGDALCTDDAAYQDFRAQVRASSWRQAFLARPLAERKHIIGEVRRHSESAKQEKALEIMDVNPEAVAALLRAHGYPTLIHGHTHRPGHHVHEVDGHACERWVLSDWRGAASWLLWDGKGFTPGP